MVTGQFWRMRRWKDRIQWFMMMEMELRVMVRRIQPLPFQETLQKMPPIASMEQTRATKQQIKLELTIKRMIAVQMVPTSSGRASTKIRTMKLLLTYRGSLLAWIRVNTSLSLQNLRISTHSATAKKAVTGDFGLLKIELTSTTELEYGSRKCSSRVTRHSPSSNDSLSVRPATLRFSCQTTRSVNQCLWSLRNIKCAQVNGPRSE